MKYRLIAAALLIAVLGGLAVLTADDTQPQATAAPPSTDDAAFKNLNIN